jgi:hypothetical protein
MLMNKQYYYSDNKLEDYTPDFCARLAKRVTHVICDFAESVHDCGFTELLKKHDMTPVYRLKKLCYLPTFEELEADLKRAKMLGFDQVAVDAEDYLHNNVWDSSKYINLPELIKQYFEYLLVFPESFGKDRYANYPTFLNKCTRLFGCNFRLLLEGTYENWLPWKIIPRIKETKSNNSVAGVWPESLAFWRFVKLGNNQEKPGFIRRTLAWPCRVIQDLLTKWYPARFWYTETKAIPRWPIRKTCAS